MSERLLHVCLRNAFEKQPALAAALKSIAPDGYEELDWMGDVDRGFNLRHIADRMKPTVVFMQLQSAQAFTKAEIRALRGVVEANCVIIQWDGDLRGDPATPDRKWFVDIGKLADASLVTNTEHPPLYQALGVRNPGYFQIGIDPDLYKPSPPTPDTPDIVLLASKYASHSRRGDLVETLARRYGKRFAVYGAGWHTFENGRPMLNQDAEAGVYAAAKCALSMSIRNDLPHYTSDRLFRALASGAVTLIEKFPGMVDLGLIEGQNSFSFGGGGDLFPLIDSILDELPNETEMRAAASSLGREKHSWAARMPDLLEIITAARKSR